VRSSARAKKRGKSRRASLIGGRMNFSKLQRHGGSESGASMFEIWRNGDSSFPVLGKKVNRPRERSGLAVQNNLGKGKEKHISLLAQEKEK